MEKTVVARLRLELGQYLAGLTKGVAATKEFGKEVSGVGASSTKNVQAVGHAALLMGGVVAAGMGLAVKAAMDWETAWAGVTKTVSGSKSQMADLETGLRGLATTLPTSHKEIAAVAEAAGQLGIQRSAIVDFTKTMVALGVSTNLTADEAATGIAKIMNVMQTPQAEVGRFGATLVALGNVGASTESEILEMASRLAGAGKLVGASESDVLALANAMTSMGIEAQLGGGAFSRVMLKIFSATKDGGDKLKAFAAVAGVSADKFAADFKKKPIQAIDGLIHGLDRIDKGGGNVIAVLRDLGFKGTQDLQVLLKLKGSGELLAQSLKIGSKAWQDNTALVNEANKRYATTASQLAILKNNVVDVGIKFGGVLLPALKGVTGGLNKMVSGFGAMPAPARTAATAMGGILTVGLGLIGLLGTFGPKVSQAMTALNGMGTIGPKIASAVGPLGGILTVAGIAMAIYTFEVGKAAVRQAEAKARTEQYTQAIKDQNAATGRATDSLALTSLVAGDVGTALRKSGVDLDVFIKAMNTGGTPAKKMRTDLRDLEVTLRQGQGIPGAIHRFLGGDSAMDKFIHQLETGKLKGTELGGVLLTLAQSGDFSQGAMARLVARLREGNEALTQGQIEAKNKAAADAALAAQSAGTAGASGLLSKAFQTQAKSAADATKAIKEMVDAEHAAIDPLFGMLDAIKANNDAQDALNKAVAGGKTSAADLQVLQLAAAKSALGMDDAATQLAGSIAAGTVNMELAKAQLQEWVDKGLITKATAVEMGKEFDIAGAKADHIAGERVIDLKVKDEASATLDMLIAKAQQVGQSIIMRVQALNAPTPTGPGTGVPGPRVAPKKGSSVGGWAGANRRPGPTDTIDTALAPGEFIVRAGVAHRNAGALEHLNRTGTLAGTRFTGAPAASSSSTALQQVIHLHPAPVELTFKADDRHLLAWLRSVMAGQLGGDVQRILGPARR